MGARNIGNSAPLVKHLLFSLARIPLQDGPTAPVAAGLQHHGVPRDRPGEDVRPGLDCRAGVLQSDPFARVELRAAFEDVQHVEGRRVDLENFARDPVRARVAHPIHGQEGRVGAEIDERSRPRRPCLSDPERIELDQHTMVRLTLHQRPVDEDALATAHRQAAYTVAARRALLIGFRAVTTLLDPLGLVGTTIVDKYAIESIVGQGGFATVFRATHILWKRPVAVKVFTALGEVAEGQRAKLLQDFIQEGALLAELSERSTAICQARDVGMLVTPKGHSVPYMVLEWLDGKPLDVIIEKERAENASPRSLEATVRLLEPIADALALAHSKGIAHRDIKPANIFVLGEAGDGGVKLLDFGIAKVVQDAQKIGFGKTAGHITSFTPFYGAPEQFNRAHGSTGPWTDVFALALVAVEVVSGKEPLAGDTIMQLAYAAADVNLRPTPRAHGVTTSDDVEAIFLKALAVKPEERYQTAGEFWNALRLHVIGDRLSMLQMAPPSDRSALGGAPGSGNAVTAVAPPSSPTAATALAPPSSRSVPLAPPPAPPARSRAPLFVGLALAALAIAGGGAFALRSASTPATSGSAGAPPASTPPPASASGSARAASAKPSCPAGMLLIPGGEFFMGSEDKDAEPSEKPLHKVKLASYCIDELEVTVAQYKECSDRGACRRAGKENNWPGILPAQRKIYDPLCTISDPVGKGNHPINCVDWEQAREACEVRGGRLPTEAEWEFAARGSDGRVYPWGDERPSADLLNACGKECVGWQKKHPDPENGAPALMYDQDDGYPNTAPVGSFPKGKSRWGLQDVVGNVWEWVSDYYAAYDKAGAAPAQDPKGPATGEDRVIRGGAWNGSMPSWVRPSFRFHAAPDARTYGFGFRCASSP